MVVSNTNYSLQLIFGNKYTTTDKNTKICNLVDQIDDLYIVQDINRFLPTFRLKMEDVGKYFSSFLPYDNRQSRVRVVFGPSAAAENLKHFDFNIYRRFSTYESYYDVEGALEITNFSRPLRIRAFTGNVDDTITQLASEMGIDDVEVSGSLKYEKTILQPNCSNAELLNCLKNTLLGKNGEAGYFCFITTKLIKDRGVKKVLVFKHVNELYNQGAKYTFRDCPNITAVDRADGTSYITLPIMRYKVYDNYKLLDTSGCNRIDYNYFDYDNTEYGNSSITLDNYLSLTEFFAIDSSSNTDNVGSENLGRYNSFSGEFTGAEKNKLWKKVNNLSKIWITTIGVEDLYPGDIVRLQFFGDPQNVFSQQYHGFWMVERVIQSLGKLFTTKLLLTRNGMNSDLDTNLLKAEIRKRA